ncbi:MAG: fimbrillin family protein, partial [Bacteroidales bacterium]|nr:fimbrillin family protein [Bacteroidales bacterium]
PVNICMSHALAKLVLNPTLGTEVTGDNIATVEVQNMYTQGTLNVEVNNWTNCTGTTAFTMTNNEVLVVPMEGCESFPIVITMESGRVFSANISLANVDNKLEGGTQYTIKLQIGHDTVTIGDISAASWGTPVVGGDLETE